MKITETRALSVILICIFSLFFISHFIVDSFKLRFYKKHENINFNSKSEPTTNEHNTQNSSSSACNDSLSKMNENIVVKSLRSTLKTTNRAGEIVIYKA